MFILYVSCCMYAVKQIINKIEDIVSFAVFLLVVARTQLATQSSLHI